MFGIYLFPQTIPLLFGIPACELSNQMIDLDAITTLGADLEDQILNSASNDQRIILAECFLKTQLAKNHTTTLPVLEALKHIISAHDTPKVSQLAAEYFVSTRQLERQFQRFAGFSPKQFIRIARFQRAMQFYGRGVLKLADIALDCGYYDQSHFINDFKQFAGVGPRAYFSGKSPTSVWRD